MLSHLWGQRCCESMHTGAKGKRGEKSHIPTSVSDIVSQIRLKCSPEASITAYLEYKQDFKVTVSPRKQCFHVFLIPL